MSGINEASVGQSGMRVVFLRLRLGDPPPSPTHVTQEVMPECASPCTTVISAALAQRASYMQLQNRRTSAVLVRSFSHQ